jgi:hypothetical protein
MYVKSVSDFPMFKIKIAKMLMLRLLSIYKIVVASVVL